MAILKQNPFIVTHGKNGSVIITEMSTGKRWQLSKDHARQFARALLGTQGGREGNGV